MRFPAANRSAAAAARLPWLRNRAKRVERRRLAGFGRATAPDVGSTRSAGVVVIPEVHTNQTHDCSVEPTEARPATTQADEDAGAPLRRWVRALRDRRWRGAGSRAAENKKERRGGRFATDMPVLRTFLRRRGGEAALASEPREACGAPALRFAGGGGRTGIGAGGDRAAAPVKTRREKGGRFATAMPVLRTFLKKRGVLCYSHAVLRTFLRRRWLVPVPNCAIVFAALLF